MGAAVWKNLLKYGIGLGLLAWVLVDNWNPKPGKLLASIQWQDWQPSLRPDAPGLSEVLKRPVNLAPLVLAAVIASLGLMVTFLRWHVLVEALGLPFSRRDAIRLGLIGYYFSSFLPGSVSGDVVKAVGIAKDQSRRTAAVATVLIDRAVGLWALVWFVALIGGAFWLGGNAILLANTDLQALVRMAWVVVGITSAVWVALGFLPERRADRFARRLAWLPKVGGSLAEFWRACWMYRKRPGAILLAMVMSLVGHTGWVMTFHLAAQTFDTPNPAQDIGSLPEHFLIVPVGMVIMALFPSPGGVGGGEAAFGWLYTLLGKPAVNGILGCLAQRIVFYLIALTGAVVFTRMRKTDLAAAQAAPPPDPSANGQPTSGALPVPSPPASGGPG